MNPADLSNYFYAYAPATILVVGAIVVLFSNAFASFFSRGASLSLSMIFLGASLLFCLSAGHRLATPFSGLVAEIVILVASFFFIFLTFSKHSYSEFQTPEFYPLYLFSASGFMFMSAADNLILVLLGLEIGSLPLATLIAFNNRISGIEAGLKYFISGALASIFFIFGILLFYLYSGSFEISSAISLYLDPSRETSVFQHLILFGGVSFILAGLGFKVSLVPWHTWMADVYEASNPVLAGYISVVPKIAGFVVFFGIFGPIFSPKAMHSDFIRNLVWLLLVITMTVPNIAALLQKDLKRMLAFSSISHSGFALACIYLGNFESLAIYWVLFLITNLGAFALLWVYRPTSLDSKIQTRFDYALEKFHGLGRDCPVGALLIAFFMLSLAGIPPFSIFWGKIFVVKLAVERGEIILALVMMINSAVAVCYYLRPIVAMFFKPSKAGEVASLYTSNATASIKFVVGSCLLLSLGSVFVVYFVRSMLVVWS